MHPKLKIKEHETRITADSRAPQRINRDLREESQAWEAEQKDRLAKELTGEAAIEHYNEWMAASGMEHLITK